MSRKKQVGGSEGVMLGLIITPMLDMSFQMLAFFIMVYHPSALEGHIEGKLLPPAKFAVKSDKKEMVADPLPSVDNPPDLSTYVTVKINSVPKGKDEGKRLDGMPRTIQFARPGVPDLTTLVDSDGELKDGLKKLTDELKKILAEPGNTANSVKLEAEPDLKHEYMMQVYDACRRAGFQNISFVAPPHGKKKG